MFTLLTGLLSSFSYVTSDMLSQRVVRVTHPLRVVFWVLVVGAVLIVPATLLIEGLPHGDDQWRSVAVAALSGAVYVAAYFALLAGLRRGDLSVVTAMVALECAFTAAFAIVGGEQVTALVAVGLVLAVIGGVLASLQGRAKSAAGAGWGLASAFLFAVVVVLYDHSQALPALSIAAVSRLSSLLVTAPLALAVARGVAVDRRDAGLLAGAGALEALGLVLASLSVAAGPLAVAGVAVSQFAVFGLLLGLVVLHERPRPHQLVGVAFTIVAVSMLAVA
jgi:drug/metabolite transporter (DMT)-like permease